MPHYRIVAEKGMPQELTIWHAEEDTPHGWKHVYGTSSFSHQETEELLNGHRTGRIL